MSEYQYYEFQTVDRPLTPRQMAELRAISSRAADTPTSFYSYGSFKGNEVEFLERYFDAHVYVANWGTHILMFGMPRKAVDAKALQAYQAEGSFSVLERGERVILTLESNDEGGGGGGWVQEGEGARWMASLLSLREDILNGDYRAAYLGWLRGVQASGLDDYGEEDEADYEDEDVGALDRGSAEPPIPPGLGSLTGTLRKLVEFLELDQDLVAVAAEQSETAGRAGPSTEAMKRWIGELPAAEKDHLLLRVLQRDAHLQLELRRRFREATETRPQAATADGRTIRVLLRATAIHRQERERREAEAEQRDRARRAEEAARARDAYLKSLIGQERALWRQTEGAIEKKLVKEYDRAVEILKDLRDLADREGKSDAFGTRVSELRKRYRNRPVLLERLNEARLLRTVGLVSTSRRRVSGVPA